LNLSKEIQLDALEMVRRAERGVGLAIRKGQAEGTVAAPGDNTTARRRGTDLLPTTMRLWQTRRSPWSNPRSHE